MKGQNTMLKKKREQFIKMPNSIIKDTTLPYSAKRVLCALLSRVKGNSARITIKRLAVLSGCSVATVSSSLSLLCEKGIISKEKNTAYNRILGIVANSSNCYTVLTALNKDYTQIPTRAIQSDITHSAFALYCYIKMVGGNNGKSYPSLAKMQRELQMAMSTICSSIKQLRDTTLLNVMHSITVLGDFACNTYQVLNKFILSLDNTALYIYRL